MNRVEPPAEPRAPEKTRWVDRALNTIERVGNMLPDPAALFLILLFLVWGLSALLAPMQFTEIDPRTGEPLVVNNLLTGPPSRRSWRRWCRRSRVSIRWA
jgi:p-aminobenzoyl-glutamate transporter AbgT